MKQKKYEDVMDENKIRHYKDYKIKLNSLRQQMRQQSQSSKIKQIRYRKLTLAGGNTIVACVNASKPQPKGVMIQFPMIDQNTEDETSHPPLDPKHYEDELYKKNNYRAMKALMKAYEDNYRKKSSDSMNMLGLDIRKIHYEAPQKNSSKKIKKILMHNYSANSQIDHTKDYPMIYKNKLTQNLPQDYKNRCSSFCHQATKPTARSQGKDYCSSYEKDFETNRSSLVYQDDNSKFELTDSTIIAEKNNKQQMKKSNHSFKESKNRKKSYEEQFDYQNMENEQIEQRISSRLQNQGISPKVKKLKKEKKYLYEKLAGKQKFVQEEVNLVYDRRIRSYTDFLCKLQFSHNFYNNLDLKPEQISVKGRRMKYYVGGGNNSAMVKGLLKRRYWWVPCQQKSQCAFIWTQIKINQIYKKQQNSIPYLKQKNCNNQQQHSEETQKPKRRDSPTKSQKLSLFQSNQLYNDKILNEDDLGLFKKFYKKYQEGKQFKFLPTYSSRVSKIQKPITIVEYEDNIIHNHLQNNFYLGNKKALFYNLKQYYGLMKENVFDYIPLTFHIKKGMKDMQYKRFIAYYNRRKQLIKKEEKIEEEEEDGFPEKRKTRNIWIVKPGENTNQGRGITVIDEIYELNNIMRNIGSKKKNACQEEESKRTYIVQMYIDRPMLYNNRKFDIRHYMLITNIYGVMRGYWYTDGYIRTSSYQFNINNFEPEIHLTNDAIQKKYPQYSRYEPFNKISYDEFQRYLDSAHPNKKYSFKEQILTKMKKMGTDAIKSIYTKISPGNKMNNFEIFGLDFMIDKKFKPWLIEINTNPCLDCSCPLLDRIIPYMLEQSLKLSLDVVYPPPSHYPNTSKHFAPLVNLQAFKYELIFDSQIEGQWIKNLYKQAKTNLIDEIGDISDDEQFKDDGKQIKLDDFT